jgi:DNA polymerase theta
VILHNARMGRDIVGPSMLRQMRRRAGRKGKDEIGETYLCCREADLEDVVELMRVELPQISSSLLPGKRRIQRALLEVIAIRLATGRDSLDEYVRRRYFTVPQPQAVGANVDAGLAELQRMGFISADGFNNFQPTRLGLAVVASCVDPDDGLFIHDELKRALRVRHGRGHTRPAQLHPRSWPRR